MTESSYQRVRKALDEARAQNASDQEVIDTLVDIAKTSPQAMEVLKAVYREAVKKNRTDFSAAIEERMFNPSGGARPVTLDSEAALKRIGESPLAKKRVAEMDEIAKRVGVKGSKISRDIRRES